MWSGLERKWEKATLLIYRKGTRHRESESHNAVESKGSRSRVDLKDTLHPRRASPFRAKHKRVTCCIFFHNRTFAGARWEV